MSQTQMELVSLLVFSVWAGVMLTIMWAVWVRPDPALVRAPRRRCGLMGLDALALIAVMLTGAQAAAEADFLFNGPILPVAADAQAPEGDTQGAAEGGAKGGAKVGAKGGVDAGRTLRQTLTLQLGGQGLACAYLLLRVWLAAGGGGLRRLGLVPRSVVSEGWLALVGTFTAVPMVLGISNAVVLVLRAMGEQPEPLAHDLLEVIRGAGPAVLAGFVVAVVVLAPLLEELIFRAGVQTALLAWLGPGRRWLVILLAAVLFTAIHSSVAAHALPGLLALSVLLGWLYERSGSIWPCVAVHAVFNGLNVLAVVQGWVA